MKTRRISSSPPRSFNRSGFTLIELSLVLVIISMITGAIIGGQALIQQARLQKLIAQIKSYETAFNVFFDKYNAYPGDMPNATAYWPGQTQNGNGNGLIEDGSVGGEDVAAFEHLYLAGITPFKPKTPPYTTETIGGNLPRGPLDAQGYRFESLPCSPSCPMSDLYGRTGVSLIVGSLQVDDSDLFGPALTSADAAIVDKKIDDGAPNRGKLLAEEDYASVAGGVDWGDCVLGRTGQNTPATLLTQAYKYNTLNTKISCTLRYFVR